MAVGYDRFFSRQTLSNNYVANVISLPVVTKSFHLGFVWWLTYACTIIIFCFCWLLDRRRSRSRSPKRRRHRSISRYSSVSLYVSFKNLRYFNLSPCQRSKGDMLLFILPFSIWLGLWMGKMNWLLHCDWLGMTSFVQQENSVLLTPLHLRP